MSKDFMDELNAKVGGSKSLKKDYKSIINELNSITDQNQVNRKLNEELSVYSNSAKTLEEKSKWKEAAVLYFEGAMILQEILGSKDNTFLQWVDRSSECLVNLANEYITWKEVDRSSAAIAIANLIHFLKGEWTLLPAYTEFNSKYSSLIQTGKTASQSLWIPYDIVNSIDQINAEFLQRAESYTQTALLTETKITESFRDAIYVVLGNAREAMTSKLKLPNIETTGGLPKDIVFGEKFSLDVELKNIGEGEAKNVTVSINKIEGLNLTNGSYTISFESLNVNNNKKVHLEFVCPSGEGVNERKFDLSGKVDYLDVINNRRQNPIGPYTIIVRTFRKADELKEKLNKVEKAVPDILNKFNAFKSSETESKLIADAFIQFYNNQKLEITNNISNGEFPKAESAIEILDVVVREIGSNSISLISSHDQLLKSIENTKNIVANNIKNSQDHVSKIEKSLTDFENKWK